MSSARYATPLTIEPHPSRGLLALLLLAHAGAVVILLLLNEWPWSVRLFLLVAVLASLWTTLGKQGWRQTPARIQRLVWQTENDWRLEFSGGETLTAELLPSSFLHPWLVILNLRVEGRRLPVSVALPRDSLDATTFRQLRVRLTTQKGGLFDAENDAV